MRGELELYQKDIDVASKPVLARLEHYHKVMYEIRKLLKDYFFNISRTQKLTESAQKEELVFSFNLVKKAMEACLVNEEILIQSAQKFKNEAGQPCFVTAFDSHIANSGLALEFQEENSLYIFKPEKPYTPTAQAFMQQFAYALSVYRIGLGVYEIYCAIYFSKETQTEHFKNYIESAQHLKQQLAGQEVNLIDLHSQTKTLKKEILSMLRTEKIHQGIDSFKYNIESITNVLIQLLESGAIHVQNCYKEFPNNAILWMLHDRSWHSLLKNLSKLLYDDQYTYSTLYGTLEIKKEFTKLIQSEINHFVDASLVKTPLLKIELLKKAAKLITELKIDILSQLAEKGIELVEAPNLNLFSNSSTPNMYQFPNIYKLMYAYQQKHSPQKISDEELIDEKKSEDFYHN
ncbi:MAG: hypothetical protein HYX60_01780 [Legionella longbeachae]|nr:hypothetical protein [Legionella longbeachae]